MWTCPSMSQLVSFRQSFLRRISRMSRLQAHHFLLATQQSSFWNGSPSENSCFRFLWVFGDLSLDILQLQATWQQLWSNLWVHLPHQTLYVYTMQRPVIIAKINYHFRGKFRVRKSSRISRFYSHPWKFSPRKFIGKPHPLYDQLNIPESFQSECSLPPYLRKFSPSKVSRYIQYVKIVSSMQTGFVVI